MTKSYVVYFSEQLRDGYEDGATIFPSLERALEYINSLSAGCYGGSRLRFRLFELGVEIPLAVEAMEEPQPPKTTSRFKVKE